MDGDRYIVYSIYKTNYIICVYICVYTIWVYITYIYIYDISYIYIYTYNIYIYILSLYIYNVYILCILYKTAHGVELLVVLCRLMGSIPSIIYELNVLLLIERDLIFVRDVFLMVNYHFLSSQFGEIILSTLW